MTESAPQISYAFSYHASLTADELAAVSDCTERIDRMRTAMEPDRFNFTREHLPLRLHDQDWLGSLHEVDDVYRIEARDHQGKTHSLGRESVELAFAPRQNSTSVTHRSLRSVGVMDQLRYRDALPADLVELFSTWLKRVRTQHYRGLIDSRSSEQKAAAQLARSESLSICKCLVSAADWQEATLEYGEPYREADGTLSEEIKRSRSYTSGELVVVETHNGRVFDPRRGILQRLGKRAEAKTIEWTAMELNASIGALSLKGFGDEEIVYASIENQDQIAQSENYSDPSELSPEIDFLRALKKIVAIQAI